MHLSFSLVIPWHPGIYSGQDVSTGQDSQSDRGKKSRWWQWMLEEGASCCPPLVTLGPDGSPRFWQGGQVQLSVWAHAPAWLHSENQSAKLSKLSHADRGGQREAEGAVPTGSPTLRANSMHYQLRPLSLSQSTLSPPLSAKIHLCLCV